MNFLSHLHYLYFVTSLKCPFLDIGPERLYNSATKWLDYVKYSKPMQTVFLHSLHWWSKIYGVHNFNNFNFNKYGCKPCAQYLQTCFLLLLWNPHLSHLTNISILTKPCFFLFMLKLIHVKFLLPQINIIIFILAAKASCGPRNRTLEKTGTMWVSHKHFHSFIFYSEYHQQLFSEVKI